MLGITRRRVMAILLPVAGVAGAVVGCQGKLIYLPRPYASGEVTRWDAEPGTRVLAYSTKDGNQQAYLLAPGTSPQRLWIVCGGNGTLALEWSDWLRAQDRGRDAWLLVDIPGYGACEGKPHPATIRRSLEAVVPAALEPLGWSLPADRGKLRFFGHSLGGAVCLMAAEQFDIRRGVLLAPFTSTMEMSKEVFGVNLGFLVRHRFDNRARLKQLAGRGDAEVLILHGTVDEAIPVTMSRELAREFPALVRYMELPGGHHNDLPVVAEGPIRAALAAAGE